MRGAETAAEKAAVLAVTGAAEQIRSKLLRYDCTRKRCGLRSIQSAERRSRESATADDDDDSDGDDDGDDDDENDVVTTTTPKN